MSLALVSAWALALAVRSVADVPDPRPASLVVDQAGVLDDATERRLDAMTQALRGRGRGEVAVVTVDDVPGTPKAFATELFNSWHLGSAARNDGVLVLLVMGQRRLEVETGDGMQAALPAWWLAEMQAQAMVPLFKRREFGRGLDAGVVAIVGRLDALPGESERDVVPGEYRADGTVVAPGGTTADGLAPSAPFDPYRADDVVRVGPRGDGDDGGTPWLGYGIGGVGAGGLGLGGVAFARWLKRRRQCTTCKIEMTALDEQADDAHLDAGQRTEERIKSVDYEVLVCGRCHANRTLRHGRWFSGRSTCSGCGYKAGSSSSTTLVSATYDHGGTVQVTETCAHCSHHRTYTRSTARLTRPSSSGSSGGHSSGGSSGGSRSSGGRSSGGGAGSSW